MKESEGKKKPSTKDKKHHDHVASYLRNEQSTNVMIDSKSK